MSNTLLTPTQITRKALMILHNKLSFIGNIKRDYDKSFAVEGAKIGEELKIRLPNKYAVTDGATMGTQDTTEQSTTLACATQKHVPVSFTSAELSLSLDDFAERILDPAMAVLASALEADAFSMYKDVPALVGTPGTTPATLLAYLDARTKLNKNLCPKDKNRFFQINSEAGAKTVDALKGLFQDSTKIAEQYREGLMGRTAGFDFYENELVPVHTVGPLGGTPLVNGANQTGATLSTKGWTAAAAARLKKGDVFTVAGVYAVHPETKTAYNYLQQFTVTADFSSDASGNGSVGISPSIVTTGALKTVSASPADGAAITVVGTASTAYPMNLAHHRDAFAFVTADLVMPKGVDFAAREVYDGISMRIVRDYDISNDKLPCRIDVLYGYKTIRPELACRLIG